MEEEVRSWPLCKEGEALVEELYRRAASINSKVAHFADLLHKEASLRFFDLIDFIRVGKEWKKKVEEAGFGPVPNSPELYFHPKADLPHIHLCPQEGVHGIGMGVESIEDFVAIWGRGAVIEGGEFTPFQQASLFEEGGVNFYAVERRKRGTIYPEKGPSSLIEKVSLAKRLWSCRPRIGDGARNLEEAIKIAEKICASVGGALAATIVLERERLYWQAKNRAGQIQKARQDRLGLGWANHDHHTFRSSRSYFRSLVELFEKMGFQCRERFYAGVEAGWGAQVMEHPEVKMVLFLDVDLAEEELDIDFAHTPLAPLPHLGTIGLWCALHGDSILDAGMHHLEGQFLFDQLGADLKRIGVKFMDPFSHFSYLRQAFSEGEIWPCDPERVERLFLEGKITQEQKRRFLEEGAIGSHLENLERRHGYKGFNQKNVSWIIKKTDPRHHFPEAKGA